MRPYEVPFGDWVEVYLKAHYEETTEPHHGIVVFSELDGEKNQKLHMNVVVSGTATGRDWYTTALPLARHNIGLKIKLWQAQGWPITDDDIVWNIQKVGW
ncbi:MAG TPA: hypothetical protein QGH10_18745 [Armatimonadota bacterium]|nr:hypothetical protein [Armatimonadota bacterium]